MEIKDMIAVLQAAAEGKAIEFRHRMVEACPWVRLEDLAAWRFDHFDYRVKPTPREWWAHPNRAELTGLTTWTKAEDVDTARRRGWIRVREVLD